MALTLEIVTPEAKVYSDSVESVVIPTTDGEIGVLPGHIPLLTQVDSGELRATKDGKTLYLAVSGGFAEIEGDRVSILAENAMREEAIDTDAVQKAVQRAQDALKVREKLDPSEIDRLEGILRFSIAQLSVKHHKL